MKIYLFIYKRQRQSERQTDRERGKRERKRKWSSWDQNLAQRRCQCCRWQLNVLFQNGSPVFNSVSETGKYLLSPFQYNVTFEKMALNFLPLKFFFGHRSKLASLGFQNNTGQQETSSGLWSSCFGQFSFIEASGISYYHSFHWKILVLFFNLIEVM